jgi:hypothetical protein
MLGTVTPGSDNYGQNSVVQFTVIPAAGASFTGWSGEDAGDIVTVTENGNIFYRFTMSKARSLVATFEQLETLSDKESALSAPEVTEEPVEVPDPTPVPVSLDE